MRGRDGNAAGSDNHDVPVGKLLLLFVTLLGFGVRMCADHGAQQQQVQDAVTRMARNLGPPTWTDCPIDIAVSAEDRPAGGLDAIQTAAAEITSQTGFVLTVSDDPATSRFWILWADIGGADAGDGEAAAELSVSMIQKSGGVALNAVIKVTPGLAPGELVDEATRRIGQVLVGADSMTALRSPSQTTSSVPQSELFDAPLLDVDAIRAAARTAGCPGADRAAGGPDPEHDLN